MAPSQVQKIQGVTYSWVGFAGRLGLHLAHREHVRFAHFWCWGHAVLLHLVSATVTSARPRPVVSRSRPKQTSKETSAGPPAASGL
eukprot:1087108-Rhodomonas_salina.2